MTTTMHPLAEDYLGRLDRAAQTLPPQDREELLAELRSHLEAGLPANASDADVRNILEELGSPEDIVAAARPDLEGQPMVPPAGVSQARGPAASPWGALEVIAVVALTVGTFVLPVIGPLVGIVLVWASTRWTRREKGVATFLTVLPVIVLVVGALGVVSVSSSGQDEPVPVQPRPGITSGGLP